MGDGTGKVKAAIACAAAVAGIAMATAAASAQGPGDYEPPPTTTLPGPGPGSDTKVEFDAEAKAGKRLKAKVKVKVECAESCTAEGRGQVRLAGLKRSGSTSFALKGDRVSTDAGKATLELKVPRRARRIANRESYDGKIRGRVTVTASDAAGNVDSEQLRVRYEKRKKR